MRRACRIPKMARVRFEPIIIDEHLTEWAECIKWLEGSLWGPLNVEYVQRGMNFCNGCSVLRNGNTTHFLMFIFVTICFV